MNPLDYIEKTVKVLDAQVKEDEGDENKPQSSFFLWLLLQEVNTPSNLIFTAVLSEEDIRKLINSKNVLSSKQLIDLAIALRQREDPIRLLVPNNTTEITVDDIIQSKNLDPKKSKRYRKRRRKYSNNNNNNRKQNSNE
jgi:hypothetical protein